MLLPSFLPSSFPSFMPSYAIAMTNSNADSVHVFLPSSFHLLYRSKGDGGGCTSPSTFPPLIPNRTGKEKASPTTVLFPVSREVTPQAARHTVYRIPCPVSKAAKSEVAVPNPLHQLIVHLSRFPCLRSQIPMPSHTTPLPPSNILCHSPQIPRRTLHFSPYSRYTKPRAPCPPHPVRPIPADPSNPSRKKKPTNPDLSVSNRDASLSSPRSERFVSLRFVLFPAIPAVPVPVPAHKIQNPNLPVSPIDNCRPI
jgi:hypothetical protein